MKYLTEGLVCLESPWEEHHLFDLRDGSYHAISARAADLARQLIRGVSDEAWSGLEGSADIEAFVEDRDTPFDEVLREKLAALDDSFGWTLPPDSEELLRLCEQAHSLLRHSRQDLDQLPVLPETATRRALELARLFREAGIERPRLALVGDDDLISIPAAALGMRPTVFDLDRDLTAIIRLIAEHLELSIEVVELDLKAPLPSELVGRFDGFCTDPETSRECITCFMSRAVALTRPGGVGLIANAEEWQPLLDEAIQASRLERPRLYRRFANYRDMTATLAHYRSDLHVLAVGAETKPLVPAEERFEGALFPFGLATGHHLLARLEGCNGVDLASGPALPTLLRELVEESGATPRVEDGNPLPLRVVTATSDRGKAQATVSDDGRTVEVDLTPVPTDDDSLKAIAQRLQDRLGAGSMKLRSLRRLE
jgi:hypothetical protein